MSLSRNVFNLSRFVRKPVYSDHVPQNRAVQPQKMARSLKFPIQEVEGLYYLCIENIAADQLCINDQLHGYGAADLRLCFRICKKQIFSWRSSNKILPDAFSILSHGVTVTCSIQLQ